MQTSRKEHITDGTDTRRNAPIARIASWVGLPMPARHLWAALAAIALLATSLSLAPAPTTAWANDYPGQEEIAAARAAVEDAAATVDQLDAAIESLEDAYHEADVAARLADEDYVEAAGVSEEAAQHLAVAVQRADDADAALDQARSELAHVAMATYRTGGSMGQLEALVVADGFDDVIVRSELLGRASTEADMTVQTVAAAELVATTMRDYAEQAAVAAEEAEQAAREALEDANQARLDAQNALLEVESTRQVATERLAELRGVSVELERERQAGFAAERQARERAAQQRAQNDANQPPPSSSGGSSSGNNGGSSGGNNGGSSGGGGGSSPSDPPPAPAPPQSGSWKSSAAQGQAAAAHAVSLVGSPYLLGGNGPAYDCSGLSQASWSAAGISIPRSSRQQYQAATHVPLSDLRPGDLIFWGTNRDASRIYHVAVYIGNGVVAEASTPGVPAKTRVYNNWAVGDIMPYAGRP